MPGPEKAGRFDIADIVRDHRAVLESSCSLSTKQKRVLDDIERCRTSALGGHLDRCVECDYAKPAYNSCRNRHCPKCQALAQEKWIAAQEERTLDVQHFHVVFTLPEQLRSLARYSRFARRGSARRSRHRSSSYGASCFTCCRMGFTRSATSD